MHAALATLLQIFSHRGAAAPRFAAQRVLTRARASTPHACVDTPSPVQAVYDLAAAGDLRSAAAVMHTLTAEALALPRALAVCACARGHLAPSRLTLASVGRSSTAHRPCGTTAFATIR